MGPQLLTNLLALDQFVWGLGNDFTLCTVFDLPVTGIGKMEEMSSNFRSPIKSNSALKAAQRHLHYERY